MTPAGPLAIPLAVGVASAAAGAGISALLKPKTPPPPTPPAPEQAFSRPNSLFTPGTGSFNGTFFGGAVSPSAGGLGAGTGSKSLLGN